MMAYARANWWWWGCCIVFGLSMGAILGSPPVARPAPEYACYSYGYGSDGQHETACYPVTAVPAEVGR